MMNMMDGQSRDVFNAKKKKQEIENLGGKRCGVDSCEDEKSKGSRTCSRI